ncbi:type II toxin-antitoxin system RelE/ParE family toxin [Marivirga tractuosa]|jgi:plasmid stabilization system protein ParE|uniref:type II toxin-antitoxin system RelE/ParE family toxin n=1 Tax=Marivirga tractuosa TaxID=1006 RepID=UPI0035D0CACD
MAQRKVIWTKTADIQFIGILEYWVNRNKSNTYSKKLISLVSQKTKLIAESPYIYKPTDYKDIRVASLENFSLYYSVTEKHIIIYAFWDNRQDPRKLLKILESKG